MLQAALAKKPCVVSNVYPLGDVCKYYNLGETFEVEDLNGLCRSIKILKDIKPYQNYMKEARFEEYYFNGTSSWEDMARLVIK